MDSAHLISIPFLFMAGLALRKPSCQEYFQATEFVLNEGMGVIFYDSQSALQTLNSLDRGARKIAHDIRKYVYCAKER